MTKDEALIKIATVNAMDYEYQAWAREALANDTSQERVDKTSEIVQEPWSPVSIGVDITEKGAHVIGIYAMSENTSQIFYAKYYPVPQRTWVGLTDEEQKTISDLASANDWHDFDVMDATETKLKEKNND